MFPIMGPNVYAAHAQTTRIRPDGMQALVSPNRLAVLAKDLTT